MLGLLTVPSITLPVPLRRVELDNLSVSSGGVVTVDKLQADRRRLESTYTEAYAALTRLYTTVRSTGFITINYPQYDASHLAELTATMEDQFDECITLIDEQTDAWNRLDDFEDSIREQAVRALMDTQERIGNDEEHLQLIDDIRGGGFDVGLRQGSLSARMPTPSRLLRDIPARSRLHTSSEAQLQPAPVMGVRAVGPRTQTINTPQREV